MTLDHRLQSARISAQRSRTKQVIVGRRNRLRLVCSSRSGLSERRMLAVSRQQIHPRNVIAGNQTLNLIENCRGIERAQLWLQSMSLEPHSMPVGLARLRSARLSHVGATAATERHKLADVKAHCVGD